MNDKIEEKTERYIPKQKKLITEYSEKTLSEQQAEKIQWLRWARFLLFGGLSVLVLGVVLAALLPSFLTGSILFLGIGLVSMVFSTFPYDKLNKIKKYEKQLNPKKNTQNPYKSEYFLTKKKKREEIEENNNMYVEHKKDDGTIILSKTDDGQENDSKPSSGNTFRG